MHSVLLNGGFVAFVWPYIFYLAVVKDHHPVKRSQLAPYYVIFVCCKCLVVFFTEKKMWYISLDLNYFLFNFILNCFNLKITTLYFYLRFSIKHHKLSEFFSSASVISTNRKKLTIYGASVNPAKNQEQLLHSCGP